MPRIQTSRRCWYQFYFSDLRDTGPPSLFIAISHSGYGIDLRDTGPPSLFIAISHSGYGIYHVTAFRINSPATTGYGSVSIATPIKIIVLLISSHRPNHFSPINLQRYFVSLLHLTAKDALQRLTAKYGNFRLVSFIPEIDVVAPCGWLGYFKFINVRCIYCKVAHRNRK